VTTTPASSRSGREAFFWIGACSLLVFVTTASLANAPSARRTAPLVYLVNKYNELVDDGQCESARVLAISAAVLYPTDPTARYIRAQSEYICRVHRGKIPPGDVGGDSGEVTISSVDNKAWQDFAKRRHNA
jgi:hypothetical protein